MRDPNEKRYETSDGEAVTLDKMVRIEPGWAASRIRCGESASRALFRTRGQLCALHDAVTKRIAMLEAATDAALADAYAFAHSELSEVAEALRLILEGGAE